MCRKSSNFLISPIYVFLILRPYGFSVFTIRYLLSGRKRREIDTLQ